MTTRPWSAWRADLRFRAAPPWPSIGFNSCRAPRIASKQRIRHEPDYDRPEFHCRPKRLGLRRCRLTKFGEFRQSIKFDRPR